MSVVVYKAGNDCEVRGIKCIKELVHPDFLSSMVKAGWALSPEELATDKVVSTKVDTTEEEIRQEAKSLGIKNWYNKGITQLKVEIKEWQQEI